MAKSNQQSTTLTRGKETRTVTSPDDVVRLKYEGWTVKSEPKEKPKGDSGSSSSTPRS